MIEIRNLHKSFGDKVVINDLTLTINDGSLFGLVGINGAGKSTLLRLLSGVYKADSGEIYYDGVSNKSKFINKKIFFLSDDPYYPNNSTVSSILEFYSTFYDLDYIKFDKYFKLFNLDKAIREVNKDSKKVTSIKNFSKGMKRQLFICIALAICPKYLFLDEAFDGLDPLARLVFKKLIIELVEENDMTVIISSHSLRELEDICDNYCLIDNGVIQSSGSIEEQKNKYHKYQLAFNKNISKEDLEDLNIVSYNKVGRVIKIVCEGEKEELEKIIANLNPLFYDEIDIDFEELFIIEVERKGYM